MAGVSIGKTRAESIRMELVVTIRGVAVFETLISKPRVGGIGVLYTVQLRRNRSRNPKDTCPSKAYENENCARIK